MRGDQDHLIAMQQAEIERLRERVRQLEDALAPGGFDPPIEWSLTPKEAAMLSHLTTREIASKESLYGVLYSGSLEQPDIKIIDVFICKLRKKLSPHGVEVKTVWGRGYSLVDRHRYAGKKVDG